MDASSVTIKCAGCSNAGWVMECHDCRLMACANCYTYVWKAPVELAVNLKSRNYYAFVAGLMADYPPRIVCHDCLYGED